MILVIDRNRCFLERKSRDLRPGTGNEHVKVTHFLFFHFLFLLFFQLLEFSSKKFDEKFDFTRERSKMRREGERKRERERIVPRFRFLRLFQLEIFERDIRGRMLSVQEAMYLIPINQ